MNLGKKDSIITTNKTFTNMPCTLEKELHLKIKKKKSHKILKGLI